MSKGRSHGFRRLAYHLTEAGESGNVQITGAVNTLIPQMRIYAANIFSDIDPTEASGVLQAASLVDLVIALASFAETMDILEQVVQYNPTSAHDLGWIFFFLRFEISGFPMNQASNADDIWDPAILQCLDTKDPSFLSTQLFALVTTAINNLRSVEFALCNYDENVSALTGAGIFIHALRHFERLLSQWTIFHLLKYIAPHLLSQDHLLFPKILIKPVVRPKTQPGGRRVFSHPIYSFLFLLLCLLVSAWSLHPLRIAIIFFSSQRSRYSFQPCSPFWSVLHNIPLLLPWPIAYWVLFEGNIHQLVPVTVVAGFVIFITKASKSKGGSIPAFAKQAINIFFVDPGLYEFYFIIFLCYINGPLATQLNLILIHFILRDLLVSTVDPTGLRRARAYYSGDIPTEYVHNLPQIEASFHP